MYIRRLTLRLIYLQCYYSAHMAVADEAVATLGTHNPPVSTPDVWATTEEQQSWATTMGTPGVFNITSTLPTIKLCYCNFSKAISLYLVVTPEY